MTLLVCGVKSFREDRAVDETRGTRRERYREETKSEIKRIALAQLAAGGQEALSLNAISREMGMSGPALYRYFANRNDLLTALIIDGYRDLGVALSDAVTSASRRGPTGRMRALAKAMRSWALEQPHRYLLLFGTPFSGYHAPEAATSAAQDSIGDIMLAMGDIQRERTRSSRRRTPLEKQLEQAPWVPDALRDQLSGSVLADTILSWSRLHGLIALEINGQFASMGFDPQLLLDREIDAIVSAESS